MGCALRRWNHEIVLFDEPTSALDPHHGERGVAVIRRLAKNGMTMVIVTHEMDFARDASNRVFYMDEGTIYEEGTPQQIFENPLKEKTRSFIHRIRTFNRRIASVDFDLYAFSSEVELFCEKHFLPLGHATISLLVEELLYSTSDLARLHCRRVDRVLGKKRSPELGSRRKTPEGSA